MRRTLSVCGITALLLVVFVGPVQLFAHSGAKGVVKERMEIMKSIGAAMKDISKIARGKVPLDSGKVANAARELIRQGKQIPMMFPAGSGHGVTEASPEIWNDPEGFKKSADEMINATQALLRAAESMDPAAIRTSYRAVGKTCSSCHRQFRIKKRR